MSLFGAMSTAISGLNAQSAAFSNIGDNVANSQTVGFKGVDTTFADYLTTSTAAVNDPGTVIATPQYLNNVQGTVTASTDPLALAISGQGFFSVSRQAGTANGQPVFGTQQQYTRAGDWTMNKDGYLVNGSGNYLNGWMVQDGAVDRSVLVPIRIDPGAYGSSASATKKVSVAANLPASPSGSDPIESQVQVYDSLGTSHTVRMTWTKDTSVTTGNAWEVAIEAPDSDPSDLGTKKLTFGADGTLSSLDGASGAKGTDAALPLTLNFGQDAQDISISLGSFGSGTGLTQFAGTQFSQRYVSQDGVPPGTFSSVTTKTNGDIQINYDNGQSRIAAHVPLTTFANPNALQREDGQAFSATADAGVPQTGEPGADGAGSLVTQSVEASNVDIAAQFTKLIVAQRAYSANTKVVTTADELLQQTLDMKR